MRILVLGAGAIGSAFGGFLSKKHQVALLGRSPHIDNIRKKGLKITGIWGNHIFKKFHTLYTEERDLILHKPVFDYILITTRATDTGHAAKIAAKIIKPETYVVSLQNGLGNIEVLQKHIPSENIIAGRVIFGVVLGRGEIEITVFGDKTLLGPITIGKCFSAAKKLASIFVQCGLESKAVKNILPYIWSKVIYNSALNPLATILQSTYGDLLTSEETKNIMRKIIEEIYKVAEKKKVKLLPPTPKGFEKLFFGTLVPRTAAHYPSMLQAINNGKRTEINALNGAIVEMGKSLGVSTPVNETLTHIIKAKEILKKV